MELTTEAMDALKTYKLMGLSRERAVHLLKKANLASDAEIEAFSKTADWSDWGRFGLDMAGTIGGGALGSFVTPFWGTAAGGFIGSQVGQWLGNRVFGAKKPQPPAQSTSTTQQPQLPQPQISHYSAHNTLFNPGFTPYSGPGNKQQLPTLLNMNSKQSNTEDLPTRRSVLPRMAESVLRNPALMTAAADNVKPLAAVLNPVKLAPVTRREALSFLLNRLRRMAKKANQLPRLIKLAASAWRRPGNFEKVKQRVEREMPQSVRQREYAARVTNADLPDQKSLVGDHLRTQIDKPLGAPNVNHNFSTVTSDEAKDHLRTLGHGPLSNTQRSRLSQQRSNDRLADADPLVLKQQTLTQSPTRTNYDYENAMRTSNFGNNPDVQRAWIERNDLRADAQSKQKQVQLIQEYMKKVLPYLAGGAGIAGAGVLAANS